MYNNREYKPTHLSATSTTQVFTGKGILHGVVINATTGTQFAIYDGISNTTGTIALMKASIVENSYEFDATVANGLYITCGSSGDYTVLWTQ